MLQLDLFLLLFASLSQIILVVLAWQRRKLHAGQPFLMMMIAGVCITTPHLFAMLNPEAISAYSAYLWAQSGALIGAVATFWFAMAYTERHYWTDQRVLIALWSAAALLFVGVLTDPLHHLYFSTFTAPQVNGLLVPEFTYGSWYLVLAIFGFILLLSSLAALSLHLAQEQSRLRAQVAWLLLGLLIPVMGIILNRFAFVPVNLFPLSFALSGLLLTWVLTRGQLLDLKPIAQVTIFNDIPDAVFVTNMQGRITSLNAAARELLGSGAEAIGEDLTALLPIPKKAVVTITQPDGSVRHYERRIRDLRQHDQTIGRLTILRDVTTLEDTMQRLNESEASFRALVENSPDLITRLQRDSTHLYVNPALAKAIATPAHDIIGKTNADLNIPPELQVRFDRLRDQVYTTQQAAEIEFDTTINDETAYLRLRVLPEFAPDGSVANFMTITHDITPYKLLEAQLRTSEALYRTLAEQSTDAISLHDSNGRLIYVNPSYAQLMGHSIDALLAMSYEEWGSLIHPQDFQATFLTALPAVLQGQSIRDLQCRIINAQGTSIWVDMCATPVFDGEGTVQQFVATTRNIDKRRRIEEQLRHSEQLYRTLAEQSSDAIALHNADGRFIYVNPAFEALSGYTLADLQAFSPKELSKLVHPDDLAKTQFGAHRTVLTGKTVASVEYRLHHKDGHYVWVESYASPIVDDDGEVRQLVATTRNIEARRAEAETAKAYLHDIQALQTIHLELSSVKSLDQLYQQMIELTRSELEIDRMVLFRLNEAGDTLYGTYGTDREGNLRDEAYYQENIAAFSSAQGTDEQRHWTSVTNQAPMRTIIWDEAVLKDNGTPVGTGWKVTTALWNGERVIGYMVADNLNSQRPAPPYIDELFSLLGSTFGHLIERQEVEDILRRSRQRYRGIVDTQTDLIARSLPDTTLTFVNDAYCHYFGKSRKQLIGTKYMDQLPVYEYERVREHLEALPNRLRPIEFEHWVLDANGEERLQAWIDTLIVNAEGEPIEIQSVGRDITDLKLAQEREVQVRLEQERLQLLTTFIRGAAHEFRTPLSAITTSTYLMSRSDDPQRRQDKAAQIDRQVIRLTRLVDTLLLMAKLESGATLSSEEVDLHRLVLMLTSDLQAQYGEHPTLTLDISPTLPTVMGDLDHLHTALLQILDNAYRFTPSEGSITISSHVQDNRVWLSICDTGIGIDDAAVPYIFDTFWRADETHNTPGLGLGLAIAKKIIDAHDGEINVTSPPQTGSCFTIGLPHAKALQGAS